MTTEGPVNPPVPTEPSQEARTMHDQFRMTDPNAQGVGLDKLRPFYPRVGWHTILSRVAELEAAGMLKKRPVLNSNGGIAYEVYTWQTV